MKISSKGRYAVRLVVDIAKQGDEEFVSLKDVSLRQEISIKFLEQISRLLVKNNILISGRGAMGGYKLSRSANKITVAQILQITSDLTITSCTTEENHKCPRCNKCESFNCWEKLNFLISSYLNSVTIEKLINEKL